MELVGKTLRSKINGALFQVTEVFKDKHNGQEYYSVLDLASGKHYAISRGWFEKGYMQNLEIVN